MGATNKLYFGDNLNILRDYVEDASVDLIYLDPPFDSSATYYGAFVAPSFRAALAGLKPGATKSSGNTSYAWDLENRLTSATVNGVTTSFKYDPFGRRVYKSSSAGTTVYVEVYPERSRRDGDNLIEELGAMGVEVAHYTQGPGVDEPLAATASGVTSFYEADGLGSITSLTNAAGALANTYTYDSFGNLTGSSRSVANPYRFTAREFDPETGLYYYRARYYDQTVGRFISEDPIRFEGGPDFYTYVLNDPVDNTDAIGLEPETGCRDCKGKPLQGLGVARRCCSGESPMANTAPNPYLPWEGYATVNAGMMFKYGGNGPWGQLVRSCLLCMYRHGATANQAHWFCYSNAASRTSGAKAAEGFAQAVVVAVIIDAGQVAIAIDSKGTNIQAVGPWYQFFGGGK